MKSSLSIYLLRPLKLSIILTRPGIIIQRHGVAMANAGVSRVGIVPHDRRVSKVAALLQRGDSIDIKDLADTVNLSVSRLEHLFKKQMSVTMTEYLLECRLKRAATLLDTSEMRIKEISHASGYNHPSSFVRAFSKQFGVGPTVYRNR